MSWFSQLTVPGEARRSGSLRRGPCPAKPGRCSCLVPAWEHRLQRRPGNQKPTITRSGCHSLFSGICTWPAEQSGTAACLQPFFLPHAPHPSRDHRCASENVNRAAVSSVDGWIRWMDGFGFLTNKSREWPCLHWSVARGSIIFVWLKLMTVAGQGPARCSIHKCLLPRRWIGDAGSGEASSGSLCPATAIIVPPPPSSLATLGPLLLIPVTACCPPPLSTQQGCMSGQLGAAPHDHPFCGCFSGWCC